MKRTLWMALGGVLAVLLLVPAPRSARKFYFPNLATTLGLVQEVDASYIPSAIKSLTPIDITVGSPPGSNTQTVSVTAANSILYNTGQRGSGNDESNLFSYALITNNTTVTVTSQGNSQPWRGQLIEFAGFFVKSQGCNTATIAASTNSGTATISSVNTAKTLMSVTGYYTPFVVGGAGRVAESSAVLTNSTTITFTRAANLGGGDAQTVGFCYLELR